MTTETKQQATLYHTTELGIGVIKREVYLLEHGREKYAQYDNAPFVRFIIRGKRTPLKLIKGFHPFILVLNGWDCPDVPDAYDTEDTPEVILRTSKYQSYDENYLFDFNAVINPFITANPHKVIADYRYITIGHNGSLAEAIADNNTNKIMDIERRALSGEVVRII